jgi:hypothetical protein
MPSAPRLLRLLDDQFDFFAARFAPIQPAEHFPAQPSDPAALACSAVPEQRELALVHVVEVQRQSGSS